MVGIYKITNLLDGKCYIGQSKHIEKRWKQHFQKGYGAVHKSSFQQAIDQYGEKGFSFEVLEECNPSELEKRERHYIEMFRPEYNSVFVGHEVGQKTRDKISKSLSGVKQPREVVEKRTASIIQRYKLRPREYFGGNKKKCAVLVDDGVTEFETMKELAQFLNVNVSSIRRAILGKRKVKGYEVWYVV